MNETPVAAGETLPAKRSVGHRNLVALLMLLAASLGAATALWTARTELMVSKLERQLSLGRMTEVFLRHDVATRISLRTILEQRQRDHLLRADQYAGLRRTATGDVKHEFALLAQQEDAQSYFEDVQRDATMPGPADRTELDVPGEIDAWVFRGLAAHGLIPAPEADEADIDGYCATEVTPKSDRDSRSGLEASSTQSTPMVSNVSVGPKGVSWSLLESAIHARRNRVLRLSLLTAAFIGALLCMTIANVMRHEKWISNICLGGGVLLTVGTAAQVTIVDATSSTLLTGVSVTWLLLAGTILAISRGLPPSEDPAEPAEPPGVDPVDFKGNAVMSRKIHGHTSRTIVLVAITALLSGIDGYLFTRAQHHADEASEKAFASEADFNARSAASAASDADGIADAALLLKERLRCDYASQLAVWAKQPGKAGWYREPEDVKRACGDLDSPRIKAIAANLDRYNWDARPSVREVVLDAYHARQKDPNEAYARADGYITLAGQWVERSIRYLCAMTIFGIAIYLCGQSLGMGQEGAARTLEVAAIAMAVAGALWVAQTARDERLTIESPGGDCAPPGSAIEAGLETDGHERAIEAAAFFYSDGRRLLERALSPNDFQAAQGAFRCAQKWHPEFSGASGDLSVAIEMSGSVDANKTFMSLLDVRTLNESTRLLKRAFCLSARAGWQPSVEDLTAYGFNVYFDGLTSGNMDRIEEARRELQRAAQAVSGLPKEDAKKLARMVNANLGLVHLAVNEPVTALQDYAQVVRSLHAGDGEDHGDEDEFLASAITDLEAFAANCPKLQPRMDVCDALVKTADDAKGMLLRRSRGFDGGERAKGSVDCWAAAHGSGCTAKFADLDPAKDHVVTALKRQVADDQGWTTEQIDEWNFEGMNATGAGGVAHSNVYWGSRSHCLPAGEYRVDAYLNGLAVGRGTVSQVAGTEPYLSYELNLAACVPSEWHAENLTLQIPGIEGSTRYRGRALVTPAGRSAAFLLALFAPDADYNDANSRGQLVGGYCRRAWNLVKKTQQFDPTTAALDVCAGPGMFTGDPSDCPRAEVLHKEWMVYDGTVYVAFVLSNVVPDAACSVTSSIGNFNGRGDFDGLGGTFPFPLRAQPGGLTSKGL